MLAKAELGPRGGVLPSDQKLGRWRAGVELRLEAERGQAYTPLVPRVVAEPRPQP